MLVKRVVNTALAGRRSVPRFVNDQRINRNRDPYDRDRGFAEAVESTSSLECKSGPGEGLRTELGRVKAHTEGRIVVPFAGSFPLYPFLPPPFRPVSPRLAATELFLLAK